MRRTKIICTLGPACRDEATLTDMLQNGMNVARFNFSHGDHAYHKDMMDTFRTVRDRLGVPAAIMLDTKGPEIRLGILKTGKAMLQDGQTYFPVEQILTALGGSVLWTPEATTFSLGDVEVLYYDGVLHAWDGEMWDARGKTAHDFYATCFTRDIFEDCFRVSLTYEPGRRAYTAARMEGPEGQ